MGLDGREDSWLAGLLEADFYYAGVQVAGPDGVKNGLSFS